MAIIIFTRHADDMCEERGILREWVERTIASPDALEADRLQVNAMNAFRSIPENSGRVLRVVYVPDDQIIRVVTVFFDRRRKP
jgi:hypothetical protein